MRVDEPAATRAGQSAARYRRAHPYAHRWASGTARIGHSLETQDRIFRMAEQMGCRRQWNDGSLSFALLQEVDDVVEAEAGPFPEVLPVAAAAAGARAYRTLFGLQPAVSNGGWPDGFETIQEGEADLAAMGLRARGFDPIMIYARDPAAYAWALFEMHERNTARIEAERSRRARVPAPYCLAVLRGAGVRPARVRLARHSAIRPLPDGRRHAGLGTIGSDRGRQGTSG